LDVPSQNHKTKLYTSQHGYIDYGHDMLVLHNEVESRVFSTSCQTTAHPTYQLWWRIWSYVKKAIGLVAYGY
jgi:hypothetical protein